MITSNFFPYFQPVTLTFYNSLPGKRKMNEVIFLFFVMMTVGVYFRICDLITATLQENVMMAKCGRYYRSYEHNFRHNTHNCDGRVNLVFHSFFKYTM